MIKAIILIITGMLLILVPHFVLPLRYLEGGMGAKILSLCSIWYHPEVYLGLLTVIAGMVSLRYKKADYVIMLMAVAILLQAFILRPVSYYVQNIEPLVLLGQTISLRSHVGIRYFIALFSAIMLTSVILAFLREHKKRPLVLTLFQVSSANIRRKLFRSALLIMSLTIIIGAFFSNIFLTRSIENTLELGAGRLGADLMVVPEGEEREAEAVLLSGGPTMFYMKEDIVNKLETFPEIEKVSPQMYVRPFTYKVCCTVESFLVIAYDPVTDFTVSPWIQYTLKRAPEKNEIVVGNIVKFYPGQKLDLFGSEHKVVASLEPTGLGYFDNSAFIPLQSTRSLLKDLKRREKTETIRTRKKILDESFSHLFASDDEEAIRIEDIDPDGISAIFVKAKGNISIRELSEKIEKTFEDVSVINVKTSTVTVKRHLTSMLRAFFLPLVILLIMGTIILSVVFSMIVNERQREIGLLRAMGGKKGDVSRILITEALILTVLGGIFGILFGSSLLFLFKNNIMAALGLLYIWPSPFSVFSILLATMIISLFVGIVASLYPAIRASKMEPYYAIRSAE